MTKIEQLVQYISSMPKALKEESVRETDTSLSSITRCIFSENTNFISNRSTYESSKEFVIESFKEFIEKYKAKLISGNRVKSSNNDSFIINRVKSSNNDSFIMTIVIGENECIIHFAVDIDSNGNIVSKTAYATSITIDNSCLNKLPNIEEDFHKVFIARIVKPESSIHILNYSSDGDLFATKHKLSFPQVDIVKHYNDDFAEIHKIILDKITSQNKGLILLHGVPGSGKSNYIRHLTSVITDKILYMTPDLLSKIAEPHIVAQMQQFKNYVIVIEDAEKILAKRSNDNASNISGILNLSDGLLADVLQIKVICTFNCDEAEIDEALLRKGRLSAKYKFGHLAPNKAKTLLNELGKEFSPDVQYTLADIYN